MLKKVNRLIVSAVMAAAVVVHPVWANQLEVPQAVDAAKEWLNVLDNGKFKRSYDEAAKFAQQSVTKDQWVRSIGSVRLSLGDLLSREVHSTEYLTTMPGAPDGEYVVIVFKSSFHNKAEAYETIASMKEPDGIWKVSGYFIK